MNTLQTIKAELRRLTLLDGMVLCVVLAIIFICVDEAVNFARTILTHD